MALFKQIKNQSSTNPWQYWGIVCLFIVLAFVTSLVNPLFESTDEIRHYRYVRQIVTERTLPVQGDEDVRSQSHHPPLYYALSALASGGVPTTHTMTYRHPENPFWGYRSWEVGVDNKLQYWHSPTESFPFKDGFLAVLVPRWVNVLLGAVAVAFTYKLAMLFWPESPCLAAGAAAIVALNPQFIYLSAAINNDVIAAAAGAVLLYQCAALVKEPPGPNALLFLGLTYGLALLSKLHLAVLGAVIALALWLRYREEAVLGKRLRLWLRDLAIVVGIALLLSGWWFARNWLLYGDLTGMSKVNELWAGREAGESWWALEQGLPYLWSSLWGRFGYGQIPLPAAIYTAVLIVTVMGLSGYLRPRRDTGSPSGAPALLWVTITLFAGVVFYYMLIQPAGAMGRFLFPALPAFAVVLTEGWNRWVKRPQWTGTGLTAGMAILALMALGGYLWPAVRYPPEVPADVLSDSREIQFANIAGVQASTLSTDQARPGESLLVTVVWEPLEWTTTPYAVFIHLIDETGAVMVQRDTWPGLGRAPTTSWRAGRTLLDTYRIDLPAATYAPNQVSVRVGLYEPGLGRLPVYENGQPGPLVDSFEVGTVSIEPLPGEWPNPQQVNFGDEIALVGYSLEPRTLVAGETFTATLYWEPLRVPKDYYAVFSQVMDQDYQVWGRSEGVGPVWIYGGVITETRRITLSPDTPPGNYPLYVGLFNEDVGRLPVLAEDGHELGKQAELGPLLVSPP